MGRRFSPNELTKQVRFQHIPAQVSIMGGTSSTDSSCHHTESAACDSKDCCHCRTSESLRTTEIPHSKLYQHGWSLEKKDGQTGYRCNQSGCDHFQTDRPHAFESKNEHPQNVPKTNDW